MDATALRVRALVLLARREHSRSELRRKLLRRRADAGSLGDDGDDGEAAAAVVDGVLDALQQQGWLSDERYAASRVRTRAPKLGLQRIRAELSQRGVALDADTAATLRDSEAERARAVWQRKFGQPAADAAERTRQMRFLAGRGFAAETIRRVVPSAGGRVDDSGTVDSSSGDMPD